MRIRNLAIVVALMPVLAANLSYLLSAAQGYVDWCVPYIHGCTSISGSGRHGAAYFTFKALMIPAAVLMAFYWIVNTRWLLAIGERNRVLVHIILSMGLIASLGLVLYSTVLGSIGDHFRLQRRVGVILYFALTFLAQLLVTWRLSKLTLPALKAGYQLQLVICTAMWGLGLIHLLVKFRWPAFEAIDDIIEWNFALLTTFYYLSSYILWDTDKYTLALIAET